MLHSLVNIFAGGRSDIKVILFIFYLLVLIALFCVIKRKVLPKPKWIWPGITIVLIYLYGLLLHALYTLSNGLGLADLVITGNNGEISSSSIWHTHIAKGFVGQVLAFFDKSQMATMDAGGAYMGLIPVWVFLLGTLLLLIAITQAAWYFAAAFKPLLSDKNKRQKTFLIIGYAIATFSLIKTSIDGGIFSPGFAIGVIFITLFVLREKGKSLFAYYYTISFSAIALLALSLYIDSYQYGNGLIMAQIVALSLLYAVVLYGSERHIRWQFFIPLLMLFLVGWGVASSRDRDIYNYANISLDAGQQIYIWNEETREVEIKEVAEQQSVGSIAKQLNKNITYSPVAVPGVTCMEKARNQKLSITLVSDEPVARDRFSPTQYIKIENGDSVFREKNWQTLLHVSMHPCLPEPLSAIDGELRRNNIETYLLVNPLFYDNFNN